MAAGERDTHHPSGAPVRGRVICTVPRGLTGMGGIERQAAYLADALAAPGWTGGAGLQIGFATTRGPGSLALSPAYLLAAMARFLRLRLQGGPALVHIALSGRGSTMRKFVLTLWARMLGLRVVLHLHGSGYDAFFADRGAIGRALIRCLFRAAHQVIVLGAPWQDFVTRQAGVPAARVTILPNAVPDPGPRAAPGPGAGPCRILFLGRLGARKGVPELIAALAALQARLPDLGWQAVLAGDGDTDGYRAQAEAAGLGARIEFPGWLDGTAAAALLARADIFVLPSHAENLPVSVLEAASYGLPIVTTPIGAVPDHFADGGNALLVPAGDVAALSDALARLLADPAERARLGGAARQTFLERFSIAAYRDRLVALYRRLLAA